MKLTVETFEEFHQAVHGRPPFAWQSRLLRQIVSERAWPEVLDLPTGTGKTTCIDIALFALALDARERQRWCPRRIAMVVDRRIVVDQVADRGRSLLRALIGNQSPIVQAVADRLRSLSRNGDEPLGVFTLRGGMPKDDTWARTPDQPLVLASTVDQLGSRLLIQGYGVSKSMKPVHAGLLGNDILILLDEVHLSQPFADTLKALATLRRKFASATPLSPRFHYAMLSATPGTSSASPFRLTDEEKLSNSPIGPRLHASKHARLLDAADRTAVEGSCFNEALALIDRHDVIAVVVNRVASASTIARQLHEAVGHKTDIVLVTGRMRPLDRDDILKTLQPRVAIGRDRANIVRKLIVVGTQCIEAGADFDFDALVTEAASFDALRQRFGRVDRLGTYSKTNLKAEGVIIRDKSVKDDPIYGEAIAKTMEWLKSRLTAKSKEIDFGVLALPMPETEELQEMVAPKAHAPVLLPAYLDLWMQTSPPPMTSPDVSLWLHGPKSGPADVQVVWRADLTDEVLQGNTPKDLANAIVAAVRPSSLEAISLPFHSARRWLQGDDVGDIADVEGAGDPDDQLKESGRLAFRWEGDDSEVITPDKLRPGDTIVVPSTRGGIERGCFEPRSTAPVNDLAERAALFGRGQPMLRLHPAVLAQLGLHVPVDDADDARAALAILAQDAERTDWRRVWLEGLAAPGTTLVVDAPEPWEVLQGKRIRPGALRELAAEDGVDLTTDDDDSFYTGRSVPLAEHSADVEQFARQYAAAAGLPAKFVDDLALSGWLHDIGKADRRFQILLRGGSEIDFFKDETPWAKSRMSAGAKGAHRLAERKSGYPRQVGGKNARHEVQSVAMIEKHLDVVKAKANDIDLVLHLVASHHGHCRPFAPVVLDDNPIEVELPGHRSDLFGTIDFGKVSSKHDLHRLDSPLAERFWRLVERYGWLELCWLEAILRLADHRASEAEQISGGAQ